MATVINRLTVTGDTEEFERILGKITEYMSAQPGFLGHTLYRSQRNPKVYVEIAHWASAEQHRAAMQGEGFRSQVKLLGAHAIPEPDVFVEVESASHQSAAESPGEAVTEPAAR
ncbi:MAG TPA: antibiotic biosynthesis monooxygenase family protein [Micromonospora sp.]